MHDDDSARMVVLAKRGWLGAKTCKLDERGLGRLHMLGRPFGSSNAFRRSLSFVPYVCSAANSFFYENIRDSTLYQHSHMMNQDVRIKNSLEFHRRALNDKVRCEKKKKEKV